MKPQPLLGGACTDPTDAPLSVRVVRTLGQGRAARAQLVEAVMRDGRTLRCVEKVFAPGLLTRIIYRLSFQAPFAYQSNRDAILTCFYRRRVAAAALAVSDIDASIASPIYVRFDRDARAWVLAAEWIDGRGIKPAAADTSRIRRRLSAPFTKGKTQQEAVRQPSEIDLLVDTMHQLEPLLAECGLVGSGWQVAPRALVSTANLLRADDHYTIIDLESGIPAVLVPRYLLAGARRGTLPPFDDLDADQLRTWIEHNDRLLTFRIGPEALDRLRGDCDRLIEHSARWKDAEVALLRRPWRLFSVDRMAAYRGECVRRWQHEGVIDPDADDKFPTHPIHWCLIWLAAVLPSSLGRFCSRLVGRSDYRWQASQFLRYEDVRADYWEQFCRQRQSRWEKSGRIPPWMPLTTYRFLFNLVLASLTPVSVHRFITDPGQRERSMLRLGLLLVSPRYQTWYGKHRIKRSITRWAQSQRISEQQVSQLRDDLVGNEIGAYTRGFGLHLALKALAPIIVPAKVGGVAAYFSTGNYWFLLPLLATPVLRTGVTLASLWATRHDHIPHAEALATGWLPVVGSVAFPLQMFAARPELSTFLVRDAASKLGRRIPVYGGADSRTEIAMIRATDWFVEVMQCASRSIQHVCRSNHEHKEYRERQTLKLRRRSRFGRWIDRLAVDQIFEQERQNASIDRTQRRRAAA